MNVLGWRSFEGNISVLTIADGTNITHRRTPSASPFVTEMDTAEDIFTPIRTQSGHIGMVIDDPSDIATLVGSAPLNRAVTLTVGGNVVWKGFLSCETFTQEWDKGPLEINLPVVSGLYLLRNLYPSSALADMGYFTFAALLIEMNAALGDIYTKFVFPNVSEPTSILYYRVQMENWATPSLDKQTREMASWQDILEDVCKLFGWQCQENGENLVFLAADTNNVMVDTSQGESWLYSYVQYTADQLAQIDAGYSPGATKIHWEKEEVEIFGSEHRLDYIAGRKNITVTGKLNERSKEIWKLDILGECEFLEGDSASRDNEYLKYYTRNYAAGGSLTVWNENNNEGDIKFENAKTQQSSGTEGTLQGGSVVNENLYKFVIQDNHIILTEGSGDFQSAIIVRAEHNTTGALLCARIQTGYYWNPNKMYDTYSKIFLTGSVKSADHAWDFPSDYTGLVFAAFRIGDKYYNPTTGGWQSASYIFSANVKDGKITYGNADSLIAYGIEGYPMFPPSYASGVEGQIIVDLYVPNPTSGTNHGKKYIIYTDLGVSLARNWVQIGLDEERKKENKAELTNSGGFTDNWSQESNLTQARVDNIPQSTGVVLDNEAAIPTDPLYSNNWPENLLAARVKAYYQQARRRVQVIGKSTGKMYNPCRYFQIDDSGQYYMCVSQSVDWASDEITANFYEPTTNPS